MNNLINIIKTHKKKFYIIGILIILIFIFLGINMFKNNKNKYKEITNKDYVFVTVENNENQKLPYINIKGDKIEKINDELYEKFYNIVQNKNNTFNYKSYLDNDILYIFIEIEEYNDDIKNPKYISYYINVKNGNIYNIEDILKLHDLDMDQLEAVISNKLNSSYIEETELGYVEKGFCDFECYKDIHDINPLNKRIALFYDGEKLMAYLNYTVETIYYVETNPVEFPHIFEL